MAHHKLWLPVLWKIPKDINFSMILVKAPSNEVLEENLKVNTGLRGRFLYYRSTHSCTNVLSIYVLYTKYDKIGD